MYDDSTPAQDGALALRSLVTKRTFAITLANMGEMRDAVAAVPEVRNEHGVRKKPEWSPGFPVSSLSPASREVALATPAGGLLLVLEPSEEKMFEEAMGGSLVVAAWRGDAKSRVAPMVQRQEMSEVWRQMEEAGLLPPAPGRPGPAAAAATTTTTTTSSS